MNIKHKTIFAMIIAATMVSGLEAGGSKGKRKPMRGARTTANAQSRRQGTKPVAAAQSSSTNSGKENGAPSMPFKTKAELKSAFTDFVKRYPEHEATIRDLQKDIENKKLTRIWVMVNLTRASMYLPMALTAEIMEKFGSDAVLDYVMKLARS